MHELVSAINKSKYVSQVYANGFEGKPSANTVTKHKKLLFIVIALKKTSQNKKIIKVFDLPSQYSNLLNIVENS